MKTNLETWSPFSLKYSSELKNALQQQHHAAQFLALVGRHLVPQKKDDSNTNMHFITEAEMLIGNKFSSNTYIALKLTNFTLLVFNEENNGIVEISIVGKTKLQIFKELKQTLADLKIDVSKFKNKLQYETPPHELDNGKAFSKIDKKYLQEFINYWHNADIVLNEITSEYDDAEPVSIWPHHFDSGSYFPLAYNDNGELSKSIGIGWAIPDGMVNEPYYYISLWSEKPINNFNDLPNPADGEWIKTGWNGGVLTLSEILKKTTAEEQYNMVKSFFKSGTRILEEHYK